MAKKQIQLCDHVAGWGSREGQMEISLRGAFKENWTQRERAILEKKLETFLESNGYDPYWVPLI